MYTSKRKPGDQSESPSSLNSDSSSPDDYLCDLLSYKYNVVFTPCQLQERCLCVSSTPVFLLFIDEWREPACKSILIHTPACPYIYTIDHVAPHTNTHKHTNTDTHRHKKDKHTYKHTHKHTHRQPHTHTHINTYTNSSV